MALYEVWYSANTIGPASPMSERLAAAERLITRLIEDGSVSLWRGEWVGPEHPREAVSPEDVEAVLRSFSTWVPKGATVWMELNER